MTSTRTNERDALTPTIGFTCVARPTFVVEYAREAAIQAFAALANLGWPVVGNADLLYRLYSRAITQPASVGARASRRSEMLRGSLCRFTGIPANAAVGRPGRTLLARVPRAIRLDALRDAGRAG